MILRPAVAIRAAAFATVAVRLVRGGRTRPAVTTTPERSDPPGGITVVVPARDEASRIGPLLDALVDASGVNEIVVVDDESCDRTAAIAGDAGARVVRAAGRPDGWAGKTWALQQGIDIAAGEWIVTLDADVVPDPALPSALVARLQVDGLDLLTVGGRFECPTRPSRWLHASMLTTLVYRFGPPGGSRPGLADRLLANGQCMAFHRELLVNGGLADVADAMVEDVALARSLAAAGRRVEMLDAADLLTVRMFESAVDTWHGWGRSLGLPGVEPRWRRIVDTVVLALTMPIPLVRLAVGRADAVDMAALAVRAGTLVGTRSAYDRHDLAYWLSPLADAAAVAALAIGVTRRRQVWRGRTYAV